MLGAKAYATEPRAKAYATKFGAKAYAMAIANKPGAQAFAVIGATAEAITPEEAFEKISIDQIKNLDRFSKCLFDKQFPSALKVTEVEYANKLLGPKIKEGWRWVSSGLTDNKDPIGTAKDMPTLKECDWVLLEGKTMRLVKNKSTDVSTEKLWKKIENKFNEIYNSPLSAKNSDAKTKLENGESSLTSTFSNLSVSEPIFALYPANLPINFFEQSYGRLAGAYIRHLERLPKLKTVFEMFFDFKEILCDPFKTSIYVGDWTSEPYNKYFSVSLKTNVLIKDTDVKLIHQALGIRINWNNQSTVENTIPLKKVLEMLTCINSTEIKDCPWLVSLNICGDKGKFLLSQGPNPNQLLVSVLNNDNKSYIGSTYTYLTDGVEAEMVDFILNNPLVYSAELIGKIKKSTLKKIVEFIVCTQVAESHCTLNNLGSSRVPGTGKQARAIIRHTLTDKRNSSLYGSFTNSNRRFPMAGHKGTDITRKAVDVLIKPLDKAPCTDMSEDSSVEENI